MVYGDDYSDGYTLVFLLFSKWEKKKQMSIVVCFASFTLLIAFFLLYFEDHKIIKISKRLAPRSIEFEIHHRF